jgi:hypothetical protein
LRSSLPESLRANISETGSVLLINEQYGEKEESREEREFSWCCSFLWGFGCAERSEGERSEPQRGTAPAKAGADSRMASRPDPKVVAKAKRRTYTAEYKQRILAEAEAAAATRGGLGALLRREGLYSSLLPYWPRERADAILEALTPRKRGPKSKRNPLEEANQTKAMASLASCRDLFGDVCGKRDFDAAQKCGVPASDATRRLGVEP